MGKDEDAISKASDPPATPDEWRVIRDGVDKAHKGWIIIGPFYAVVTNWKAILIVLGVILYINQPDIIAALRVLMEGGK